MRHKHSVRPSKFSVLMLIILVLGITGAVLMNRDIAPTQTPVEEELDESAFTANK